jgi:hypothetical protein
VRRVLILAHAGILAAFAGCGPDNGLDLAKVSGTVTHQGKPLTYGSIMFEPDTARGSSGPPAIGTINKDGSFVLSTEAAGDGAVVGAHRVAIIGLDPAGATPEAALPDPEVDPKSFMVAKTKAGMLANRPKKAEQPTYTDKTGKVFKVTVPAKLSNPATSEIRVEIGRGSNAVHLEIDEAGTVKVGG